MAAGRPLVASRVGGIVDAVDHGENGLLVAPDDPGALRAALQTVVDDAGLAARLAAAGRRRYERRHTLDHMAAAWRHAWERARLARPVSA
jgi:glycosyltransferase involved in cell wall biosynthesis